ncbi:MAG: nickel pincer cofactor biosynthesis protein LarC [Caldilineaceae bacterium]|nr:nickel pincer cofactor biosynthesis protein LarC [Caldilineaceae bacterium]
MIAYLDLPSGLSGDIFLGCLVDAGWPLGELQATITQLGLPAGSWSVTQRSVMRGPLRATLVDVQTMVGDAHRHLSDIRAIIHRATLPSAIQERAIAVFTRLATAEASVHGSTIEEVHFHEVGALDAIIDIVGVCAGLAALGVEQLYASGAPLGEGWTNSAHGRIPLPAPATLALLTAAQAPTRPAPGPGELVTPTGAALLAELATFHQPRMRLQRIGLGAGQKEFTWPNVARLWLGEAMEGGELVQIETNIDDMNPELYAAVTHQLFDAGALDVWTTPIQMKKGRPALLLSVLAPVQQEQIIADLILHETTTLGVRVSSVRRHEARRDFVTVTTRYGAIPVKRKWLDNQVVGFKPEYEVCWQLAQDQAVPVRLVYEAAHAAAHTLLAEDEGV